MKIILEYLNQHKWYAIAMLMLSNIVTQLYKLITYKKLTDFIGNFMTNYSTDNVLLGFFIKLLLIHFIQNLAKYILEKIIACGIKEIFKNIIDRITRSQMNFFTKDIQLKINQIWLYLNGLETLTNKVLIGLPQILTFSIYYIYTIYKLYPPAVLFIVPINILIMFSLHPFTKRQYKLQKERIMVDLDVKNKLLEATSNIEYIKLNNKENEEVNRISVAFNKYTQNKINDQWMGFCINFQSQVFNDFLTLIIYSIGTIYIIQNKISPSALLYLTVTTGQFYLQLMELRDIYNHYTRMGPKLKIINTIMNSELEKHNSVTVNNTCNQNIVVDDHTNHIIFDHITFSYNNIANVLDDISFQFVGKKINLLLGSNGSGKSTLVKLLLRLYELNENSNIYFNNVNIKSINMNELRQKITFVSQEPYIFNDTILYNIKYGIENVDENKIIELCDILYSRDWLVKNHDKPAGFRGRNLSGGEKKKIQLINALCKNAEVIIFDEPTNTLDSNAFKWFSEFIKLLKDKYNKTVIIITHDVRLKEVSDHVIDLNK